MWFECVEIQPATLKNHEQKQMSWVCDHMHQQKNTLLDPNPLEPEPSWLFHLPSGFEFQRFGDVLKKMWDRIRYWEWEDCDLMDSWGTKKKWISKYGTYFAAHGFQEFFCLIWERHFQDRSQWYWGFLSLRGNLAGFWEDANWWKVIGQALRLLGKDSGNCRKTTGQTKNFSKMPGNDIPDLPSWSPQLELDKHQLTQQFDESESPKFTIGSHLCSFFRIFSQITSNNIYYTPEN